MPGAYVPFWVTPYPLIRGKQINKWQVYVPRWYKFKTLEEGGSDVALWDEWCVISSWGWWSPEGQWTWKSSQTPHHFQCQSRYPEILSYEAASGKERTEE